MILYSSGHQSEPPLAYTRQRYDTRRIIVFLKTIELWILANSNLLIAGRL